MFCALSRHIALVSATTEEGDTKDDLQLPTYPDGFGQEIKNQFDEGKTLVRNRLPCYDFSLFFRTSLLKGSINTLNLCNIYYYECVSMCKGPQSTSPPGTSLFGVWYPVDWRDSVLLAPQVP